MKQQKKEKEQETETGSNQTGLSAGIKERGKEEKTELFARMPVPRAVLTLVVPTVISQIITVVYNMADTFFIGQMDDPDQVAAASLSLPLFLLTTGMANLFGIGGASLVARSLGKGEFEKARRASSFSVWTGAAVAFLYGMLMLVFRPVLLPLIGADEATTGYCMDYLFWTLVVGAVPTVLNALLAHLVRAEGLAAQASFGVALGGLLNIALDPLFIFGFRLEVAGAAIATMLSNGAALVYFVVLIVRRRRELRLRLHPRYYSLRDGIPREVLLVGLPSAVMNLMAIFSNVSLNRLMAGYSNEAVAGIGIAKKIDMLAFAIANGMSQGVIPLIGYNYSAGNSRRMRSAIRMTLGLSLGVTTVGAVFLFTCAGPLVNAFIQDALTVEYGSLFQRIICLTGPLTAVTTVLISLFQAMGQKGQPLVLSALRKGGLDVPAMFLLNHWFGINGIAWATPAADLGSMLAGLALFLPFWKKLGREREAHGKKTGV